jgi:type II secretory pathway component PulK
MRTKERGSTLLAVVWLLAIMAIIATFLIYRSETEWAALVNAEKKATLREVAEQVLYERMALLLADDKEQDNPEEDWFGKTGRYVAEQDDYTITVLVEDEGSKPNLNLISENALRCFALPEELAVTPLLDWRDPDDKELDGGAEIKYYQGLNPAYQPRNGFFSSLEEMLLVKDGPELYEYLGPELSVCGKINFNILSTEQLSFILNCAGFESFILEQMVSDYEAFRGLNTIRAATTPAAEKRVSSFANMEKHPKLSFFSPDKCEKLKPFFRFDGSWNVNFMSFCGLKAALMDASMGTLFSKVTGLARKLIKYRQETKPFESLEEFEAQLKTFAGLSSLNFVVADYFTTASTLFRYRIWV